ncbi:IclR family transcriptional regulator [Jiella sp. MQZ9-1]|uniref:IclR family transcriptional regulator n=2 Tax=Jiella flava TaxID=2816857 RepID=A0A939JW61_9HYPH|nr:IclR family transcriptional regulator [Jiella flava]MCD2471758.1 IclR family transcriptional regulator [Jiella flava]
MLEMIASIETARLSDLAAACGLPQSSTHRVVNTLVGAGLVIAPGKGNRFYALGPRLLRLVHAGSDEAWIKIIVQRKLNELAEHLGETCYMTKLIGDEVISVAWATPANGLKAYVFPGLSQPLHASASAKTILAFQSPDLVRKLLVEPLPKLSPNTKTDLDAVIAELAEVHDRGYGTCINENEAGIAAVACPIFLAGDEVIYAIGTMAVMEHLAESRIDDCALELRKVAADLSRTIMTSSNPIV